ncbi:MAG: hypothetical protein ABI593_08105 [Betaproteobacteria bacterium]
MGTKQNVYGEGNYEASRQYNEATKKFVESGRVDEAAREAAPKSPQEAADMKQAEQAALLRAKTAPGSTPGDGEREGDGGKADDAAPKRSDRGAAGR